MREALTEKVGESFRDLVDKPQDDGIGNRIASNERIDSPSAKARGASRKRSRFDCEMAKQNSQGGEAIHSRLFLTEA